MPGVTILGTGPSWGECPFLTEELWGGASCLATEGMKDRKFTKLFSFDGEILVVNGVTTPNEKLSKGLVVAKERNIPVMGNQRHCTERFPTGDIIQRFRTSYFMNTISYMMAYALFKGYDPLYLYGIDQGPQWYFQMGKPHIMLWLGIALEMGVTVKMGRGTMQWSYQAGLDKFPMAFLEKESWLIANSITIQK